MIEVYDTFENLDRYKEEWNKLAEKQCTPLLRYEWMKHCSISFHKKDKLFIILYFNDNKLLAVAPLYIDSEDTSKLSIIGNKRLYEPCGLLFKDADSLDALINYIFESNMCISLNRTYKSDYIVDKFKKSRIFKVYLNSNATASQYLNFEDSFSDFEKNLSSKRRSDLKRARKKADKTGGVSFLIEKPNSSNLSKLLETAFKIEDANWKGENNSSIIKNKNLEMFFYGYLKEASELGNLLIGLLLIDNRPIACNLSILDNNKIWVLKIGYDRDFKHCSPGILLFHEIMHYGHDNDLRGIEFLGCRENWINLWKPKERDYINHYYYPFNFRGVKCFFGDNIKRLKDRFFRK